MRLSVIIERLIQLEKKLESGFSIGSGAENREAHIENDLPVTITPVATPSQAKPSNSEFQLPADQVELSLLSESVAVENCSENDAETPTTFSHEDVAKARYLERDPFTCEEYRIPLPDFITSVEPMNVDNVMPFIEYFHEHPCAVYPIMCESMAYKMLESMGTQGFGENIPSCFILLVVALSKAYKNPECVESGIPEFQRAMNFFIQVAVQFTLEYVQTQVLSALFLFKSGRLLSFRSSLHTGCTALYTLIKRWELRQRFCTLPSNHFL